MERECIIVNRLKCVQQDTSKKAYINQIM